MINLPTTPAILKQNHHNLDQITQKAISNRSFSQSSLQQKPQRLPPKKTTMTPTN